MNVYVLLLFLDYPFLTFNLLPIAFACVRVVPSILLAFDISASKFLPISSTSTNTTLKLANVKNPVYSY